MIIHDRLNSTKRRIYITCIHHEYADVYHICLWTSNWRARACLATTSVTTSDSDGSQPLAPALAQLWSILQFYIEHSYIYWPGSAIYWADSSYSPVLIWVWINWPNNWQLIYQNRIDLYSEWVRNWMDIWNVLNIY